jgi:hypothetical protein
MGGGRRRDGGRAALAQCAENLGVLHNCDPGEA